MIRNALSAIRAWRGAGPLSEGAFEVRYRFIGGGGKQINRSSLHIPA